MRSDLAPVHCDDLIEALAGAADDDQAVLEPGARVHIAQCLRCQAELASYRRLRRSLRSLESSAARPDPALEGDILLALDHYDATHGRRVQSYAAATIGGLAAAAGVIALATRTRRGQRLVG